MFLHEISIYSNQFVMIFLSFSSGVPTIHDGDDIRRIDGI